jgi:serine protease AprX
MSMMTADSIRRRTMVAGLVLALAVATPASAHAGNHQQTGQHGKISKHVRDEGKGKGKAKLDVLVRFRQEPGASERMLVQALGGEVVRKHKSRWSTVRLPGRAVEALAALGEIEYVAADAPIGGMADVSREVVDPPAQDQPETALKGAGVTIAMLDSGVAAHPEIQTLVAAVDFVGTYDPTFAPSGSIDLNGHGTHVAGIMVGNGSRSSGQFTGVAPEAGLVSVRVLDGQGSGRTSDMLAGLQWILDHKDQYGIRVLNLSLGHPVYEAAEVDPLVQAVDSLWDAGIVVVCAAGNNGRSGHGTISSPCNSRKVITVGALNEHKTFDSLDDSITTYSSQGPTLIDLIAKPDLLAPGNKIVSARAVGSYLDTLSPERRIAADAAQPLVCRHFQMSGTSMAAPFVAGAAALMVQQDPSLNPGTVKARLMLSAKKVALGDPFATGAGLLDVLAALRATGRVADAPSPRVFPDADAGTIAVENTATLWSDASFSLVQLWSNAVLWSDEADAPMLSTYAILWTDADSLLWPDGGAQPDATLWPDSTLWSEAALWPDEDVVDVVLNSLGSLIEDP